MRLAAVINEMKESLKDSDFPKHQPWRGSGRTDEPYWPQS
jgi:hypothetical protein